MACVCIARGDECVGHICTGSNTRYHVYVKDFGCRTWDGVGKPTKSKRVAMKRLGEAMLSSQFVKRGVVAILADYYDPEPIYEIVKR